MSGAHTGIRAEYVEAECKRRRHPLVVQRRRMVKPPVGPYGGPYQEPGVWETWRYCACGEFRASVAVDRREVIGKRERIMDPL